MKKTSRRGFKYVMIGGLVVIAIVATILGILLSGKSTPAPATLSQVEEQGKALFMAKCNGCHFDEGRQDNLIMPALSKISLGDDEMFAYIKEGKGMMPGFHSFSSQELERLVAYLHAIRKVAG